ncbi:unnamed protein product [Heligmosomoides polygyrus]|uniref:Uncharacterized protein n=1 Tax=Heligmosomoides polygyrus TaxID=6339 RepID=A0A183FH97_HELPZ|nr:unnamed protein product [Heligmosomoides polygyrus]
MKKSDKNINETAKVGECELTICELLSVISSIGGGRPSSTEAQQLESVSVESTPSSTVFSVAAAAPPPTTTVVAVVVESAVAASGEVAPDAAAAAAAADDGSTSQLDSTARGPP